MEETRIIALPHGSPRMLIELYDDIARALGADNIGGVLQYDCTKVNISMDLQEEIYDAYRVKYPDEYQRDPESFDTEVTMLLACSGSMVDRKLPLHRAEVFPGFLCDESGRAVALPHAEERTSKTAEKEI